MFVAVWYVGSTVLWYRMVQYIVQYGVVVQNGTVHCTVCVCRKRYEGREVGREGGRKEGRVEREEGRKEGREGGKMEGREAVRNGGKEGGKKEER